LQIQFSKKVFLKILNKDGKIHGNSLVRECRNPKCYSELFHFYSLYDLPLPTYSNIIKNMMNWKPC